MTMRAGLAGLCLVLGSVSWAEADDDVVMRAMRDELARSVAQLQIESLAKPYFIAYRVEERFDQRVSASFGSTVGRGESHRRTASVEVRVGSPALDNTNFLSGGDPFGSFFAASAPAELPLDGDYTELRRQLWLATDRAYKQAVENLSKKRSALENKTRTDDTPDFAAEDPVETRDVRQSTPLDMAAAEGLVRELSAVFRETPAVATSSVSANAGRELTRYVNSEGTSFVRDGFIVGLDGTAATQAADGSPLNDHFVLFRRSWSELPPRTDLLRALRDLGSHLTALKDAALLEQYNGPVLFEGQAAAEIFAQVFAQRLVARKRPVTEGGAMEGFAASVENPFADKLGGRVLPDFLSVSDDPTVTKLGDQPLFGDDKVDDEGVPARAVKLVEGGRLKTLLVSRALVKGIPKSTGSFQGSGPAPRNLIVSAAEGLVPGALKAELLRAVQQRGKEYGVIVRRLGDPLVGGAREAAAPAGGDGVRVEAAILAYKVFADGREELLRNVEVGAMNVSLFKDILAAGQEPAVLTVPFRTTVSPSAQVVSFAVPSLLFEDLTLKKPGGEIPKPQVARHPFFDK